MSEQSRKGKIHRKRGIREKFIPGSMIPVKLNSSNVSLNEFCKRNERAICKLVTGPEKEKGNGFFCRLQFGRYEFIGLLTAGHVLPQPFLLNKSNEFSIETYVKDKEKICLKVSIADFGFQFTCDVLDITFLCCKLRLLDFSEAQYDYEVAKKCERSHLPLEACALKLSSECPAWLQNGLEEHDRLCIIQYNNDSEMEVAFSSHEQPAADFYNAYNEKSEVNFRHTISTEDGVSGAPIMVESNGYVIGLHKEAENEDPFNVGLFIYEAVEEIEAYVLKKFSPQNPELFYNPKLNLELDNPNNLSISMFYDEILDQNTPFCALKRNSEKLNDDFPQYLILTHHKLYTAENEITYDDEEEIKYVINEKYTYEGFSKLLPPHS